MNIVFVVSCSSALLLAIAALVREVRLRRALQVLLNRIIKHWREYVSRKSGT